MIAGRSFLLLRLQARSVTCRCDAIVETDLCNASHGGRIVNPIMTTRVQPMMPRVYVVPWYESTKIIMCVLRLVSSTKICSAGAKDIFCHTHNTEPKREPPYPA